MKVKTILAAGAVLLCAPTAHATTPKLSGGYVITDMEDCTSTMSSVSFDSGLINFNSAKGTVSFNLNHTGGTFPGGNGTFALSPQSGKGTYSNTDTTVTIGSTTYQATYGPVNSKGIATYLSYISVTADGLCEDEGWVMHQ